MGKLYVGNLSWNSTEEELSSHFSSVGEVQSAKIITDRETGRSRGFGFIEMDNSDDAISSLDGKELQGRALRVSVAQEKRRDNRV